MRDTDGHRHCDRCDVILTKENNKCGYEICDKCNYYIKEWVKIKSKKESERK